MDNINKICTLDSDCGENNFCAFNDKELTHQCISDNKNDIYHGCLNKTDSKYDYIESNSEIDNLNYKNCINFTRRQKNQDELNYNYMIFKPKKSVFVDTTTIIIYLKCDDEILAIIPYNDYFTLKCDNNQENCILESKESLFNFIQQNSENCGKQIYLEIIYECENEGLKKKEKIPVIMDSYNGIKINLKCPIDIDNEKFKSKCIATYIEDADTVTSLDNKKSMYDCSSPLYKIPLIIDTPNKYKRFRDKKSKITIKKYNNEINEKTDALNRLKAEKYIKIQKIQTGQDIPLEEAQEIIKTKSTNEYWKLFTNYDAAQYLFSDVNANSILTLYGQVYTIEDAKAIASENDQSFFVWYHNTYELNNYASNLYFIDIYNIENDFMDKSNWAQHENVTTGILKLEEYDGGDHSITEEEFNNFKKLMTTSFENTLIMKQQMIDVGQNNLTDYNVNLSVVDNLNNKITTYGQAINMNNYETDINNKILMALGIIFGLVFVVFIVLMVYYNNKYGGHIKIFDYNVISK